MTKQLHQTIGKWLIALLTVVCFSPGLWAAELSGTYTINALASPSATNFQNLNSAITYLTSDGTRSDGGPSNSAPYGVSGPVTFNYETASGPYEERVTIPAIPGASSTNTITINGNGNTMQHNTTGGPYAIILLDGADHIHIKSLTIKTLHTSNGFGIHFYNNADSNIVSECVIDFNSATGHTGNMVAFVIGGTLTSATSNGPGGRWNTIQDNEVLNPKPAAGPTYMVTHFPPTSQTQSYNRFLRNVFNNIVYMGYYGNYGRGTTFDGNEFNSTTRTGLYSTRYDIYSINAYEDTIINNKFHNPFGTAITTTMQYSAIYHSSHNNNLIANNRIYDIKSNGVIEAIYSNGSNYSIYNNTISLDHQASTGSVNTIGIVTSGSGHKIKNNVISVTRGGANNGSNKVAFNLNGTATEFDYNFAYVNGPSSAYAVYAGVRYPGLEALKTAVPAHNAHSFFVNPKFVSVSNLTPTTALLDGMGADLSTLPYLSTDADGNVRGTSFDPGALNFTTTVTLDAAAYSIIPPVSPFSPGVQTVSAKIINAAATGLTSVDVNWSVNGITQPKAFWTGTLAKGEISDAIELGEYDFQGGVNHTIRVWTSNPNNSTDGDFSNDTISIKDIFTTLAGGTYTVNKGAAASATNFTSFTNLANALRGGITAQVIVNVVANSGPYNEQVEFTKAGNSVTDNVVINGNGNTIQFAATAGNYAQIRLNGAKHLTLNNLVIKGLDPNYGWGIHFINNADSNKVIGCKLDGTSQTNSSSGNAGIVFSASLTSAQTPGANGIGNLIENNLILGGPSGTYYFGIAHYPTVNNGVKNWNTFKNNIVENYLYYGIISGSTQGTKLINNVVKNPTKALYSWIYPYYFTTTYGDTVIGNIAEQPFGTITTSGNYFYGFYIASAGQSSAPSLFVNNVVKNVRSSSYQYGFYFQQPNYIKMYNNTIALEDPNSTSSSYTYGVYIANAATGFEFKNNIVYVNRSATNNNYAMYFNIASANFNNASINNNVYYNQNNGALGATIYYAGNYNTLDAFRSATNSQFDNASLQINPLFQNALTNPIPREGALKGAGVDLTSIFNYDIVGNTRSATPDLGAYEFELPNLDASIGSISAPSAPFVAGSHPISVKIKNGGTSTITSATINWSVNGVAQTAYNWTGSISGGDFSASILLGNATLSDGVNNTIVVSVSNPNAGVDLLPENDTTRLSNVYTAMAGDYTINKNAPASVTNFVSFGALAANLNYGGITNAVNVDVVEGSGPYTEQFILNNILGASSTKTITINGNGEEIRYNNTAAASIAVVGLNGADHIRLNGLNIRTQHATYGVGVMLVNGADSNMIENCNINVSSITGTSNIVSAGIAVSANFGNVTTAALNNGVANIIRNNRIEGGQGNGAYYGIIVIGTNTNNPTYMHNKIVGNTIVDPYMYGIYNAYSAYSLIKNNKISRPTKLNPTTFYGVYATNGAQADTIDGNVIFTPYGVNPANSNNAYGIYLINLNSQAATPTIVRNNVITDFRGAGIIYGIATSSANADVKLYHNTVNIKDVTSTSANATYGIHFTSSVRNVNVKNNIVLIDKSGSGNKFGIYLNNTHTTAYDINNNNYYFSAAGTNKFIGYYNSTNAPTLTAWNDLHATKRFDTASFTVDPMFRNVLDPLFLQPGNAVIDNGGANVNIDALYDIEGNVRSNTPDLGAYNFEVGSNDAGVLSFGELGNDPNAIIKLSSNILSLNATIRNYGSANLTDAVVNWSLAGEEQFPGFYSGNLLSGDTAVVFLGSVTIAPGVSDIYGWTSDPNNGSDAISLNDSVSIRVCTPFAGTVTLNPNQPDKGSNFSSFSKLFEALQNCGLGGALTVNMAEGVYSQQLTPPNNIPGHNAQNTITFEGGDSAICSIEHNGSISRATLLMNGAKHYTFNNITFRATNPTSATALHLMNKADSNTFEACAFIVAVTNSSAVNPIVASGNVTSYTTGNETCHNLVVNNSRTVGGYSGATFYGVASGQKPSNNRISNTIIESAHYHGLYLYYQQSFKFIGNSIVDLGSRANNTPQASYYYGVNMYYCDSANEISRNVIVQTPTNMPMYSTYGMNIMYSNGSRVNRMTVDNNVIDVGRQDLITYTCYGLYSSDNNYIDIAYNTVRNNTGVSSGYSSTAFHLQTNNADQNISIHVANNIFVAPNGCLTAASYYTANIIGLDFIYDHNVFYSTGVYHWYTYNGGPVAYVANNLITWSTNPNSMGLHVGNNEHSYFFLPAFINDSLRSNDPLLDEVGMPFDSITVDITGGLRNSTIPDIGAYEFEKQLNDAGVVAILSPQQPISAGSRDIVLVIRNFGQYPLTSCDVTYKVGSTEHTITYSGDIPTLGYDTVTFSATSGFGGTSQQYDFAGATETLVAWTSNPNGDQDLLNTNDTSKVSLCTGLSGVFTIDPNGSGVNNFTSIQAAINKLLCGGVYGNVVFNIAPGTYNGQFDLPIIYGTSATSTITFKSANNDANSVKLIFDGTATNNYVFRLRGTRFVNFSDITFENTNSTNGRVFVTATEIATNIAASDISLRNSILKSPVVATTVDANAVIYSTAGHNVTNLSYVNNKVSGGSMGIYVGAQNVINQYASGLVIDSNFLEDNYYYGIFYQTRANVKVRNNVINMSSNAYAGIYNSTSAGQNEIWNNIITNASGNNTSYGVYVINHGNYATAGLLSINNNIIDYRGSAGTQYGIQIQNSSFIDVTSNTVRLSSSNLSYGIYLIGHGVTVLGNTYPSATAYRIRNNIFDVNSGYALYSSNMNADSALITGYGINNNLYGSKSENKVYAFTTDFGTTNFNSEYKGIFGNNSDKYSKLGSLQYVTSPSFRPDANDPNIWKINAGAERIPVIVNDVNGNYRAALFSEGTPDIGAQEVVPQVDPHNAIVVGNIAEGETQAVLVDGDTVAWITWGYGGTLPDSVHAKFYPGSYVSHPSVFNPHAPGQSLDEHWQITPFGGSSYYADVKLKYSPNRLGTIPSQSDIRFAYKGSDPSDVWEFMPEMAAELDTVAETIVASYVMKLNMFTATTEMDPLPVKLASFDVIKDNTSGVLVWTSAMEKNLVRYEVERSENGDVFTTVASVKAKGNSSSAVNYTYTDVNVASVLRGTQAFYRLKMISNDGSVDYSAVRSVSFDRNNATTVSVYPNPFKGAVSIELNTEINTVDYIVVTDVFGREIMKVTDAFVNGGNKLTIESLSTLPTGVYIVRSKINNVEYTHKVVKQ